MKKRNIAVAMAYAGVIGAMVGYGSAATAEDAVYSLVGSASSELTDADRENAQSRLPMLTDASQLPAEVREELGIGADGVVSEGFGTANHPFTTKRATTKTNPLGTIKQFPYSGTGKLWMRFGSSWFVCTASVIDKGLLVTAAHCVSEFGQGSGGIADQIEFEPSRHATKTPYGVWNGIAVAIPSVYLNGTDVCTTAGIVCENDLAVVVLNTNGSGDYVKDVVRGEYAWGADGYGYTSFLGKQAAQITEFGYPVAFDSGYKMIRTDSLGYEATPNNVIIGTDQTGGSSGGPWVVNYGINPKSTSSIPSENLPLKVVATTSWGYTSSTIKLQGASRFGKNSSYPVTPNIKALLNIACGSYPTHCD